MWTSVTAGLNKGWKAQMQRASLIMNTNDMFEYSLLIFKSSL